MRQDMILRILDTSHELISSARIEGTAVYNREGERLGILHSVMLHKRTGRVAYAVMLLENPAGAIDIAHPLPWPMLAYSEEKSAYVVNLSREVIANAPNFTLDRDDRPRAISDAELRTYYLPEGTEDGPIATPLEEGDFNAQPV